MALLLCLPALGVNLAGGCAARCAAPRMQLASSAATNIGIQKRKLGDTDLLVSECCLVRYPTLPLPTPPYPTLPTPPDPTPPHPTPFVSAS